MCGRYTGHVQAMHDWADILQDWQDYGDTRRNIAPTSTVGAISKEGFTPMRWGLVPMWSKTLQIRYATFNARLENIDSKPAYRAAWKRQQRCLIPSGGHYEWKTEHGQKQPYLIHRDGYAPVVFGGIWDLWQNPDEPDHRVVSCSIITKAADASLEPLHPRMPVILQPDDVSEWLTGNLRDAQDIAMGANSDGLHYRPVSKAVNNTRNEGEDLWERE